MTLDDEKRRTAARIHEGNVDLAGYIAGVRQDSRTNPKHLRKAVRTWENNHAYARWLTGIGHLRWAYRQKRRHW